MRHVATQVTKSSTIAVYCTQKQYISPARVRSAFTLCIVVRFCLSAAHTREQLDECLAAVEAVVDEVGLRYSRRH